MRQGYQQPACLERLDAFNALLLAFVSVNSHSFHTLNGHRSHRADKLRATEDACVRKAQLHPCDEDTSKCCQHSPVVRVPARPYLAKKILVYGVNIHLILCKDEHRRRSLLETFEQIYHLGLLLHILDFLKATQRGGYSCTGHKIHLCRTDYGLLESNPDT